MVVDEDKYKEMQMVNTPRNPKADTQTSALNRRSQTGESHPIKGKTHTPNTTRNNANNRIKDRARSITNGDTNLKVESKISRKIVKSGGLRRRER
ncbi:hypothetical protein YC2023_079612 [Brassica napus]